MSRKLDRGSKIQANKLCYQSDANPQVKYDKDEDELKCLRVMCDAEYAMREKKSNVYHMGLVTRQGADKSLATVPGAKFKSHYPVPPALPERPFSTSVTMNHDSVFIAGRYNKYSRDGRISP